VLFRELDLGQAFGEQLDDLARQCFQWICRRLQVKTDLWHARLIQVKNTAYAWRQMLFFLALVPPARQASFFEWAQAYLKEQPQAFQQRFQPAMLGLAFALQGISPNQSRGAPRGSEVLPGLVEGQALAPDGTVISVSSQ
jgi:hypothetical protein